MTKSARFWFFACVAVAALCGGCLLYYVLSQRARAEYADAKTERERMLFCIDAIDRGLIKRGTSVSEIDRIFGTDWAERLPTREESATWGVVNFGDQEPELVYDVPVQIPYVGWYFAFQYNSGGEIEEYNLSNLHK